jgi:hypothetical protein
VPKPSSKNNDSSLDRPLLSSDSARASDRLTRNDSPPDKGLDRALFACVPQVYYHHVLQVNSPSCISGSLPLRVFLYEVPPHQTTSFIQPSRPRAYTSDPRSQRPRNGIDTHSNMH